MTLTLDFTAPATAQGEIDRRFLGWDGPFLPRAAGLLADSYVSGGELRMEGAAVVVPGARAGRRLKELLLAEAERRGVRLAPPRVVTVGALPELLYAPRAPLATGPLERRAWAMALRGLPDQRVRALFSEPPAAADVLAWARLARMVVALHHEVTGAGLTFADVVAVIGGGSLFDDSERWRALAEAQSGYERLLAEIGQVDAGLARIEALQGGVRDPSAELWLLGVVEMPRIVASMLRVLRPAVPLRCLVHAPEAEAGAFDDLGLVVPGAWVGRRVEIPDERLAVRGRPTDQADEVVHALNRLGGRFAAEEISVAVPDREILPYVERRLASAGVPVRQATGVRAARSGAARLLDGLAEYLDGHRFDRCASLLRHPDLGRWIDRSTREDRAGGSWASYLRAMDEYHARRLPMHLRGVVPGRGAAADLVREVCRTLESRLVRRLRGTRTISEWMPELLGILLEVYGDGELDRNVPRERELLEALSAIRGAADGLHHLPAPADEPVDAATALRLLVDELHGETIAPRADEPAVELLGWLEIHLDDAPVTIVTGFNEGILPESVNAHAYLPDRLRSLLGLVDNRVRYARDAYQLTALLQSKAESWVIAGRQTVRGDPLRPSRLMFALDGPPLAARVRRFYGRQSDRPRGPLALPGDTESGFALPPQPRIVSEARIDHLSVSRFGAVLQNPYIFALEHELGLETSDDAAAELDGLSFGNLAHDVLHRFGLSSAADSTDAERVCAELDRLLDEVADVRHGDDSLPAVRLQVEQLRARLHAFARWQAEWRAAGWRIAGVECRTRDDGVTLMVDGEPFRLNGRIDRIDCHEESGAWAVFDYKTGDKGDTPDRTHRRSVGGARTWVDLQLPLYRHIVAHVVDIQGERPFAEAPGGVEPRLGYIVLPRDPGAVRECFAEWTGEELEEADEAARDVVRCLRAGEFVWDPARAPRLLDARLAALLGIGYLEAAGDEDEPGDD